MSFKSNTKVKAKCYVRSTQKLEINKLTYANGDTLADILGYYRSNIGDIASKLKQRGITNIYQ